MAATVPADLEVFPLSIERYDRMVEAGILGPEDKVELLRGVLVEKVPQGEPHAAAIQWLNEAFTPQARARDYSVRIQSPVRLATTTSEPEPDIALVARGRTGHPDTAYLAIEVAVTSQAKDLGTKAVIYAAAGVPEFWVIDLPARMVHVHTAPRPDGYAARTEHDAGTIAPQDARLPAVDLDALFAFAA